MINPHIFKIRAVNGLRRSKLESLTVLSNLRLEEDKDIIIHQELTEFMEEISEMIEKFAVDEGVRR